MSSAGPWHVVIPTLADLLFVVLLLHFLHAGSTDFFNCPDTPWHIQTGDNILASAAVPTTEPFSYTRAGSNWTQTQWLADVFMSAAYRAGGYPFIALAVAVLLANLFRWLYRKQLAGGAWPIVALTTTAVGVCAASGQFLARPLLATIVGVPICFWWATQYARGAYGARRIWLLVPLAVVWCNLHPGVLGGIATVGLCGAGLFVRWLAIRRQAPALQSTVLRRSLTLITTGVAMGAATLVNPYGLGWHAWVARVMGMGSLSQYVHEWMPPDWTQAATLATALLAGTVLVGVALRRQGMTLAEGLVIAFWLVQAAQSRRHLPLLAMILVIQAGRVFADVRLDGPRWRSIGARLPLFSAQTREAEARRAGGVVSVGIVVVLVMMLMAGTTAPAFGLGTAGPPATRYSLGAIDYLRSHTPTGRIFNEVGYGGLLIREVPDLPVFIDGRYGVYGEQFLVHYRAAVHRPADNAAGLLDRWNVDTVVVSTVVPLCDWLADAPAWELVYQDRLAVVYRRCSNLEAKRS